MAPSDVRVLAAGWRAAAVCPRLAPTPPPTLTSNFRPPTHPPLRRQTPLCPLRRWVAERTQLQQIRRAVTLEDHMRVFEGL